MRTSPGFLPPQTVSDPVTDMAAVLEEHLETLGFSVEDMTAFNSKARQVLTTIQAWQEADATALQDSIRKMREALATLRDPREKVAVQEAIRSLEATERQKLEFWKQVTRAVVSIRDGSDGTLHRLIAAKAALQMSLPHEGIPQLPEFPVQGGPPPKHPVID